MCTYRSFTFTGTAQAFSWIDVDEWQCRKKKAVHKTTSTDDKRLQNTLKRLGVNTIPGIEEVNIFMDETVIHFTNPKGAWIMCLFGASCAIFTVKRLIAMCAPQSKHQLRPTHMLSAAPHSKRVSQAEVCLGLNFSHVPVWTNIKLCAHRVARPASRHHQSARP